MGAYSVRDKYLTHASFLYLAHAFDYTVCSIKMFLLTTYKIELFKNKILVSHTARARVVVTCGYRRRASTDGAAIGGGVRAFGSSLHN